MKAKALTERERQLGQNLLKQGSKLPISSGASLTSLPLSDPMRILTEYVAHIAAQIQADVERIPTGLVQEMPSLFGLQTQFAQPATAYIEISLAEKCFESFYLPADTEFVVQDDSGFSFTFRNAEANLLFSAGKIEIVHERGSLFFGVDSIPARYNPRFFFELENTHEVRKGQWSILGERGWTPVSVSDRSRYFTQSGFVQFFLPEDQLRPIAWNAQEKIWFRFEVEAEKEAGFVPVRNIFSNVIECQNIHHFSELCLGSGDASASQAFRLPEGQVTRDFQVKVFNGEKAGFEIWEKTSNFFLSQEDSKHFVYDHKESSLTCGDGFRGRKLPPGYDNVWVENLSLCDGSAANLSKQAKVSLASEDWRVASARLVSDIRGGIDINSSVDQVSRLKGLLINQFRAVTLADFEEISVELSPRLGRAFASEHRGGVRLLPILRPAYAKKGDLLNYSPESSDLDFVLNEMNERKLVNTSLIVEAVRYRLFRLEANIFVRDLSSETKDEIESEILDYFSPYGRRAQEVKPGMKLDCEGLHQSLEKHSRILAVKNLRLVDETTKCLVDQMHLEPNELPSFNIALNIEERLR